MTTATADIAPKLAGRIGECFNTALKKKKKNMGVVEDAGSTPENVVATSSNLTKGDFNGSMEQTRDLVKSALVTNGRYGKYPYIIATYSDHVFVESDPSGSGEPTRFFTVPYTIKDHDVTLAEPTEVEKITKFVIKEIAESVLKDLLHEGGAGSGNWGHKGRPGKMGGSLPAGGKGKGKKGDISPHVVGTKSGQKVHAGTFYDKGGGLDRSQYSKLTPKQKQAVLSHGVSKYKEQYVPKASQGSLSDAQKAVNAKVGGYEGMRRAALQRAKKSPKGSSEWRSIMHIAIQVQQKVSQLKGSASASGNKVGTAVFGAIRTAGQSPAKGGR